MPLAPMGCAVQIHQGSERRASWAANAIDGWYLQTSPEHYRCHVINVKQTRSERVSDTVFFKTKYLTQPTLTPADVITKALQDLTQALKGKNNQQGISQMEALKKLDLILNNVPVPEPASEPEPVQEELPVPTLTRRVTFDEATKPPQIEEVIIATPIPRVIKPPDRKQSEPINKVTIDKIFPNVQTPRVMKTKSNPKNNDNRERIRKYISSKTMARIPQRNTHLQRTTRASERAQLIHDEETNTYLNYRQLLRHPKYNDTWSKSSANEFGRLINGLKDGRVKGTNTMHFITRKADVPTDRIKDVTYGSFT
jgi:hypothetical protein